MPPDEVDGFGDLRALVGEAEPVLRVALLECCAGEDVERHRLVSLLAVPAVQLERFAGKADCALDLACVNGGARDRGP